MLKLSNFIAGQFVAPSTGQYLDVHEPATGQVYAQAPASDARDIEAAVVAAESAFPAWSALPSAERARLLLKLADLIDANLEKLAAADPKRARASRQSSHGHAPSTACRGERRCRRARNERCGRRV